MSEQQDQRRRGEQGGKGTGASERKGRSAAEWVTLGISLTFVLALVGVVTYLLVTGADQPPVIAAEARLGQVRQDGGLYYVPVVVTNEGDRTVEAVRVRAELDTGSGQPVTAETTFAFLSAGEQVEGAVVFETNPLQGELSVHAVSYQEP